MIKSMTAYRRKWKDKDGKKQVADVYTIEWKDDTGKTHREKGYSDKGATKQKMATLRRSLERGEEGLIDPFREQKARPLTEHVKEWLADLRTHGCSEKYISNAERRIDILLAECHWSKFQDITDASFISWRDDQRSKPRNGTRKDLETTSPATLNQYLDTARAFLNWCATTKRIKGIPVPGRGNRKVGGRAMMSELLADVQKLDVRGREVRKRRALSEKEVEKLLSVADEGRKLLYRTALATGLRRTEIRKLVWDDLHLNAIKPHVRLRADATKSKRVDTVYFPQSLAEDLRKSRPAEASDADRVFPVVPSLDIWKADLKAADIPYMDAMGRQVDFHGGVRQTLCTRLHRAGVPLVMAMRTMRHTEAKLTAKTYTDDAQLGTENTVLPEVLPTPSANAQNTVSGG